MSALLPRKSHERSAHPTRAEIAGRRCDRRALTCLAGTQAGAAGYLNRMPRHPGPMPPIYNPEVGARAVYCKNGCIPLRVWHVVGRGLKLGRTHHIELELFFI